MLYTNQQDGEVISVPANYGEVTVHAPPEPEGATPGAESYSYPGGAGAGNQAVSYIPATRTRAIPEVLEGERRYRVEMRLISTDFVFEIKTLELL